MKVKDCNVFINDEKHTHSYAQGVETIKTIMGDYGDSITSSDVIESKLVMLTRFRDGSVSTDTLEVEYNENVSYRRRETTIEGLGSCAAIDIYIALENKMEISTNYQTFPSGEEERDIELIDTPCGVIIQVSD